MSNKIIGHKVDLKPIEDTDLAQLWQLIYGEENPEWKNWDAPYFPLVKKNLEEYKKSRKREGSYDAIAKFAIWTKDKKIIGTVGYYWQHKESNWLEIGITIYLPQYWSVGFGREALQLWTSYLFDKKGLLRVGLTTWSGNQRMIKCAESVGMKKEAVIRKCRLWQGKYYDSVKLGVLKEEWIT